MKNKISTSRKRAAKSAALSAIVAVWLASLPGYGQSVPAPSAKNLDSARAARAEKLAVFRAIYPDVKIQTNPVTGVPEDLWGDLSKNQTQTDPVEAAYEFYEANKELYGITDPRAELKIVGVSRDELGPLVVLKQLYRGVEVHESMVKVNFSRAGKLNGVSGGFAQIPDLSTAPAIDSNTAIEIVKRELKYTAENEKLAWEYIESFGKKDLRPFSASLTIVPYEGKYYLSWKILISRFQPDESWLYFLDANTGSILFREDQIYREPRRPSAPGSPDRRDKAVSKPRPKTEAESFAPLKIDTVKVKNVGPMPDNPLKRTQDSLRRLGPQSTPQDNPDSNQLPKVGGSGQLSPAEVREYQKEIEARTTWEAAPVPAFKGTAEPTAGQEQDTQKVLIRPDVFDSLAPPRVVPAPHLPDSVLQLMEKQKEEYRRKKEEFLKQRREQRKDSSGGVNPSASGSMLYRAEIFDAQWRGFPRDCNNNGYVSLAQLSWDVDVFLCPGGSILTVYEKLYFRRPGETNQITVNGIGIDNAMRVMLRANGVYWNSTTDFLRARQGSISAANDLDFTGQWATELRKAWDAVGVCQAGDMNSDGVLSSADVVLELNCVFLGLGCIPCSEINCDGLLTAADVIVTLNWIFLGLAPNPCPS